MNNLKKSRRSFSKISAKVVLPIVLFLGFFLLSPVLAQAAERYWVGGTGNWSDDDNHWATTSGGAPADTNIPTAVDNCVFDSLSNATAYTVTVDVSATCLDLNLSQAPATSGTVTFAGSSAVALSGNLTLLTGMSYTHTGTITFNATSGTKTITSNGVSITGSITFNGAGGTWQLADHLTVAITDGGITLGPGTFDANAMNVTTTAFFSSNSSVRTLTMGSGTWTLTGGNNETIWTTSTATNLTLNKSSNPVISNYSGSTGTRTIIGSTALGMNSPDFNFTAGSGTISLGSVGSVNFTGFSGILASSSRSIYGSLTLGSSMTWTSGVPSTTFAATSGTHTITTNGVTINSSIIFNGVGGTWQLGDNFTLGSTKGVTLTNGNFNLNNYNISSAAFSSNNSNTRTLTMGSGTWTLVGNTSSSPWSIPDATNLTFNANTSTIKYSTSASTVKGFTGGGLTYNNVWIDNSTGVGAIEILGSNTFNDFKDTGSVAHSLLFAAGTTQTMTTFSVSGTTGNVITINSSDGTLNGATSTSTHALTLTGGGSVSSDYLNIQHSIATPSETWYAGANSTNNQGVATAGSGWIFTVPPPVPHTSSGSRRTRTTTATPSTPTPVTYPTDCIPTYNFSPSTGLKCPELSIPIPPQPFIFLNNLSSGITHPDVLQLQKYLNTHGFSLALSGLGSSGLETNFFGKLTRGAVIRFQLAHSIVPPVGFFGPITRGVMNSGL